MPNSQNEKLLNLYAQTMESYGYSMKSVNQVVAYFNDLLFSSGKDILGVTRQDVLKYLAELNEYRFCFSQTCDLNKKKSMENWHKRIEVCKNCPKNLGKITQKHKKHRISAINRVYTWLIEEEYTEKNPAIGITKKIKVENRVIEALTEDEVLKLIRTTISVRNRAIIMLLYYAGLRISELIDLDIPDVNLEKKTMHIRQAKGNKDRIVPIHEIVVDILNLWFKERKYIDIISDGDPLICNYYGRRLEAKNVARMLQKEADKVGLKVNPHLLRHSIATHMLNNGMDIPFIQEFLGHSSIESTMVYATASKEMVRKEYEKAVNKSKLGNNGNF